MLTDDAVLARRQQQRSRAATNVPSGNAVALGAVMVMRMEFDVRCVAGNVA